MTHLEKNGIPILAFANKAALYDWLRDNHQTSPGIWMRLYKKASGTPTIVWAEAVEVALCFGWIDSLANAYDETSYLQKLTPRRPKGMWSKINCQTAERLIAEGLMYPAGLLQVENAKADGRWAAAYDSPKNMKVPDDFINALKLHPEAETFFNALNKSNKYAIVFALATAKKPETRQRRFEKYLQMMIRGEKPH